MCVRFDFQRYRPHCCLQYIAKKLLDINERKSFTNPPPEDKGKRRQQDNELFHRARLVNCGYFMQIILGDYVGSILGLARDGHSWRLNPLKVRQYYELALSCPFH